MNKKELYGFIYAFVLGDGSLERHKKNGRYYGNACFRADCVSKNKDYIDFRANILSELTEVKVTEVTHRPQNNYYRTSTRVHPVYSKMWQRLYGTGRKAVDPHQLKFMDWQMLAILYMDDGTLSNRKDCTPIPMIYTCAYSYAENLTLAKAIKDKTGCMFDVRRMQGKHKLYWKLGLPTKQYTYFRNNIKKYILPSFEYKIP